MTALIRFRRVTQPIAMPLVFFVLFIVASLVEASLHGKRATGSSVGPMFYTSVMVYALARGRRDIAEVFSGGLPLGVLSRLASLALFASALYEAFNLLVFQHIEIGKSFYHASLSDIYSDVVAGPFDEELFFQVGLQTWLERWSGRNAIIVTALLFVGVHLAQGAGFIQTFVNHGPDLLLLSVLWWRYHSFGLCFAVHAGYNALLLLTFSVA